jgi:hypothetical protein
MPILGIVASGKTASTISTSSYESIATVTAGSGGASTVEFNSIPQTYKHLQIRVSSKDVRSGAFANNLLMQVNGVTGSSYTYHSIISSGSGGVTTDGGGNNSSTDYIYEPAGTSSAVIWGASIWDILDYSATNKNKTITVMGGYAHNSPIGRLNWSSSAFINTAAISSIKFLNSSNANWNQYSTFALYGIKG